MSDMREDVARAVAEAIINVPGSSYERLGPKGKAHYLAAGDAAIAAVFDWLLADDARQSEAWPNCLVRDFAGNPMHSNRPWIEAKKAEVLGEQ